MNLRVRSVTGWFTSAMLAGCIVLLAKTPSILDVNVQRLTETVVLDLRLSNRLKSLVFACVQNKVSLKS